MELRLNLEVSQILSLIKQIPSEQKLRIKTELEKEDRLQAMTPNDQGLTELLLNGPIMTLKEKENFKMIQKAFDIWTKTSFV